MLLVERLSRREGGPGAFELLLRPVLRHYLRPGRLVDLERAKRELDQVVELGERLRLLLGRRAGLNEARVLAAGKVAEAHPGAQPLGQLGRRELANVVAVHPAQLLLVEDRRRARDSIEAEPLDELGGREERRRLVVAPAEEREVVANRLAQIAGVAKLLH